ncbi:helix-turn-helix transcriptional regulator [Caenispirillum salinarum]|uniref:helix-turn-helix transcriptional regulator n=1 Tax=Caenispirillum salinarum TaxID=859058 RepID=UPI0002EEED8A|nr:helix-turn-helix transcriptional regulator [Caenispirillum salinarum]
MRGEQLTRIIAAIYDAAASDPPDCGGWASVARLIEAATGGACILSLDDAASGRVHVAAAPSLDARFRESYASTHARNSPWIRALRRRPHPAVITDAQAETDGDSAGPLTAGAFYRDWMEPQRFRHSIASDVLRDGPDMVVLKTLFPEGSPPEGHHIRLHTKLQPHLRRAAGLFRLDQSRRVALHAAESALEGLSVAVFLARQDGRITFMNRPAVVLRTTGDALKVDDAGRLTAADAQAARRLRKILCEVSAGAHDAMAMRLPRPSGKPDMHLMAARPQAGADARLATPTVTIYVTDPSHPPALSLTRLRDLHGLTAAEARVVAALARGASIGETARDLGVADATARHHVKQAFAKTGTHRQADLVRLILADPLMHDRREA